MVAPKRVRTSSGQSREVIFLDGWRGGLNISDSQQHLEQDETPDCLNVVFDDRGGFTSRRGFKSINIDGDFTNAVLLKSAGNRVLMLDGTGALSYYNGASYTVTSHVLTDDLTARPVCSMYGTNAYFSNCRSSGDIVTHKFTAGDVFSTLTAGSTSTWNDTYTVPVGGVMPLARVSVNHNGYFWVADTVEGGVRYSSRIRFSHVGQPEDWAKDDYFDVAPENDRDSIRGLFSFRDELLVFKESGVWAVGGWDRDSFYLRKVAPSGGLCVPTAVTSSSGIAYWVSNEGNIFAYNGEKAVPVGDAIWGLWRDGEVNCSSVSIAVWSRGRLYCVLDTQSNDNGLYVYDPRLGRRGAWTRYNFKPTSMLYWQQGSGGDQLLFTLPSSFNEESFLAPIDPDFVGIAEDPVPASSRLYDLGDETQVTDRIGDVSIPVGAYLKTYWITGGETATRKRWRRPRITAGAAQACQLRLRVYRNYNTVKESKAVLFSIGDDILEGLEWDEGDWDYDVWSGNQQEYSFVRTASLGSANAIQLFLGSPDNQSAWWVDSIAIPFRRKGIK
jgi:hypothetical protein